MVRGGRLGEAVSGAGLEGWRAGGADGRGVGGGLVAACSLGVLVGMHLAAIHGVGRVKYMNKKGTRTLKPSISWFEPAY